MGRRGQPRKYKTVEALQGAIDDYFKNGVAKRKIVIGKKGHEQVVEIPVPTITGLILYLGYADRKSFYELEEIKEYSHTIKRARTFIEKEYEEMLHGNNPTGAIFALKNFGWKDKQEVEVDHNVTVSIIDRFEIPKDRKTLPNPSINQSNNADNSKG